MYSVSTTAKLALWQRISTKMLFFVLSGILIAIFFLYIFLVNRTIMNVVARSNTQKSISSISTTVGDLEGTYLTLQSMITIDLAYQKGFKDATPEFIGRDGTIAYNTSR